MVRVGGWSRLARELQGEGENGGGRGYWRGAAGTGGGLQQRGKRDTHLSGMHTYQA